MVVVIDKPFFRSIAPMRQVTNISNCDIMWVVVNYNGPSGELAIEQVILTTLENSVEGLTAGEPLTRTEFEQDLQSSIKNKPGKIITL